MLGFGYFLSDILNYSTEGLIWDVNLPQYLVFLVGQRIPWCFFCLILFKEAVTIKFKLSLCLTWNHIMIAITKSLLLCFLACGSFFLTAFSYAGDNASVSFIRPFDAMTLTQGVKLSLGKEKLGKLGQKKIITVDVPKGKHKVQTKVGLSLAVPNVTGFNGAKKFKAKLVIDQDQHFFKVVFKPAMLGGQHEVIEIDQIEFATLSAKLEE